MNTEIKRRRKSIHCEVAQKQFIHDPFFRHREVSSKKQFKRKPKHIKQMEYNDESDIEEFNYS
jgi:stalled ribosome alternative rescue factor ArfA